LAQKKKSPVINGVGSNVGKTGDLDNAEKKENRLILLVL
jgi:hypothetical protein